MQCDFRNAVTYQAKSIQRSLDLKEEFGQIWKEDTVSWT